MSEGDKEHPSFKVVDKRRFTADGQARADAPPDEVRRPVLVNAGQPPLQPSHLLELLALSML